MQSQGKSYLGPRRTRTIFMAALAGSAAGLGCAPPPPDEPGGGDQVEERKSDLQFLQGATKWTNGNVPVCWFCGDLPGCPDSRGRADFETVSRQIRNRAMASWSTVAKVNFTGWDVCPTSGNFVQILLNDTDGGGVKGMGQGRYSMFLGVKRSDFLGSLIPHEFGHVLGFTHEVERADFPDEPGGSCQGPTVAGDPLDTPPDRGSIMASTGYCQNDPELSLYDAVGSQKLYGRRTPGFRVLTTWWNGGLEDHATVSADTSVSSLRSGSYKSAYANGWLYANQMPGTVPLKRFRHTGRGDDFTTATAEGEASARAAGYTLQATEGFVYPAFQLGTSPLKLFWSAARQDNLTTLSSAAEQAALAAGYVFVRIEGWTFRERPFDTLWLYKHAGRGDYLLAGQNSPLIAEADSAKYTHTALDAAVLRHRVQGTVALKTFWHAGRQDYFTTATAAGENSAIAAGYVEKSTEGYVFPSQQTGLSSMKSFWHSAREDNFTTVSKGSLATNEGYTLVRTEGFTFGL
jgi:hypothetical protein